MAFSPDDIYKLFIVKRTQVEMLADRGYLIPVDEIEMFLENPNSLQPTPELLADFVRRYTPENARSFSREAMSATYTDENNNKTYVYFAPLTTKEKQGVSVVNAFIDTSVEMGANVGIIITNEGFTSDARKTLDTLTEPIIQVFFDHQLYINPTTHMMTPRHTRLSPEERRSFLTKYKLQPRQILVISIDDPIVRYYGWNVGDIIKIERFNLATNKTMVKSSIAYRIVSRVKFDVEKKPAVKVTS